MITFEKIKRDSQSSFLLESLLEIFDFYPGLFENANQGPFFQFPVERNREDTPLFLHDNMARSLPFRLEPVLREVPDQVFPGNDRELMLHPPLRLEISRGGVQEISCEVLPAGLRERVLLLP